MYRHLLRHLTSFTIKTPTTPIQCILHMTTNHYPFPKITQLAPDFKGQAVINGHFKDIQLSDYIEKYVG